MTAPGHYKIKCPYCDGPIEVPTELIGQWSTCPHCQKEIPLDVPGYAPADRTSPAATAEALRVAGVKEARTKKHNRRRLIALGIALPTVVLVGWLLLKFGGSAFLNAVGVAIPGFVGLVIGAALFVLALFWAVCLLLLPIYVYFIHRTLLKIEQNTRSK